MLPKYVEYCLLLYVEFTYDRSIDQKEEKKICQVDCDYI